MCSLKTIQDTTYKLGVFMNISEALQRIADRMLNIDFATKSHVDLHDLDIFIDETWRLPFDMGVKNRRALIERAQLAKFGLKDKTIKDLSVRNSWEIPASRISIQGKKWNDTLQTVLGELAKRLGLSPDDRIELSLHNLLLYEKGQFFTRHQDTEKLPDMQASLVIILPCQHTGGELLVEKKGETKSFGLDYGHHPGRALAILFYADCHHQVKPVKTGNRLALTYNITVRQKPRPQIAQTNSLTQPIMSYFSGQVSEKFREVHGKTLLVVLLDHQYTQKSLNWSSLKGRDRKTVEECRDCQVLNDFLRDAGVTTVTLPLAKGRRQHLHQEIESLAIPVSHQTTRQGSPFKLVLKKLPSLHTQRLQEKRSILQALDGLP
jgi:hypothetical protein